MFLHLGEPAAAQCIVMGLPIGPELPFILRLSSGEIIGNLNLVKARPAGHCIFVRQLMPFGT